MKSRDHFAAQLPPNSELDALAASLDDLALADLVARKVASKPTAQQRAELVYQVTRAVYDMIKNSTISTDPGRDPHDSDERAWIGAVSDEALRYTERANASR